VGFEPRETSYLQKKPRTRTPIDHGHELLRVVGLQKAFPGVLALDNVDFELNAGEVHALLGENGAGKSTLIKVVSGAYTPDSGDIYVYGQKTSLTSPRQAIELGISTIYQELTLVPELSVAENILLGAPPSLGALRGFVDWKELRKRAADALNRLQIPVDVDAAVMSLPPAQQRMVEIAKALAIRSQILIIDEPTAALSDRETEALFAIIATLKSEGVGIIYISHRLEEAKRIGDRATVLRNGAKVCTLEIKDTPVSTLIRLMVGRDVKEQFPKNACNVGDELLWVEGLTREGVFEDVNLSVNAGEIVGIAGLVGSGRTEVARAIFGADPVDSGVIIIEGRLARCSSPTDAIRKGIGLVPEERKEQGLLLSFSPAKNITLPILDQLARFGILNRKEEGAIAVRYSDRLRIKGGADKGAVEHLSGGNQQKVILAKWLCSRARVFILDEPTRGIDVGAKVEVYELMNELTAQGAGILLISSDLPEVLGMSDRILVMARGRLCGSFKREEATEEKILAAAFGQG
jgi:ribose transport system ATP-binding protein